MDRFVKTPAELIIIAENEDLIQASKADETTRNVFTAVEIQHMCELVQRGRIQIDVVATWNIAKKRPGRPKNQPAADPRQPRLDNFLKKRDREPK